MAQRKRSRTATSGLYKYRSKDGSVRLHYNFTSGGQRFTGTLPKGRTEAEAKEFLRIKKAEATLEAGIKPKETTGFRDYVFNHYLPMAEKKGRKVERQRTIYERLAKHFEDQPVSSIKRADIVGYLDSIERVRGPEKGKLVSTATRMRHRAYLSAIFGRAEHEGLITKNPVKEVEVETPGTGEQPRAISNEEVSRYLTAEDYRRLITAADPDLRALIEFAANTGVRQGSLMSLDWQNVTKDFSTVTIRPETAKAGNHQVINCNEAARAALQYMKEIRLASIPEAERPDWPQGQVFVFRRLKVSRFVDGKAVSVEPSDEGFLETFPRVRWEHLIQTLGWTMDNSDPRLKGWRFHDLRHTFASWLVQADVPLARIKSALGHKTLAMTMRYAHLGQQGPEQTVDKIDMPSMIGKG